MNAQPHPGQATQAPRVLLVDDNTGMRRVLRGLLEDADIQVVGEAADDLEGVARTEVIRPDVVLMDWRMPRLDGVQATARSRSQLPEIQVVVFSSAEGAGMGVIARQAGASTFVQGRLSRADLLGRVGRLAPAATAPNHPLTAHSNLSL
jgi:CheY-like chemotaxis protein